jgi:hypothetical protein
MSHPNFLLKKSVIALMICFSLPALALRAEKKVQKENITDLYRQEISALGRGNPEDAKTFFICVDG